MRKYLALALFALLFTGAVGATEFNGTVDLSHLGLAGTLHSDADTTFTVDLNDGYMTGVAVFSTQTVANASATTPSLASGTLTGGGGSTFTLTVNAIVTTDSAWSGFISFGDGETTGPITITAVPAAETPPDFSVESVLILGRIGGISLVYIPWESDNAGDTTGTIQLPLGLLRSARFFNIIAPAEDYDFTLKDASGFDVFVSGGANLTSVSTTTINPVLNSTYPVGVYGAYQLLGTNLGDDRSGRIEMIIGN